MPTHSLKLLFLLTAVAVVPASADSQAPKIAPTPAVISWADNSEVACPYERARLAAERAGANKGPTTITLTERVPAEAPLLGRGSAFTNP
jgi:hypothetical protein